MSIKNKIKAVRKKTQTIKRKVTASVIGFTPIHMLVKNRRATSAVVSNLILIAAVIVVGFVALGYARSTSNNYQTQYRQTVNSDIDKLKETIAFEYAYYKVNVGNLSVYFMNAGSIGNLNITTVLLSNSTWSKSFHYPPMHYLNGTLTNAFGVGEEGYIILPCSPLASGPYTVKLTTWRVSTFATNFMA